MKGRSKQSFVDRLYRTVPSECCFPRKHWECAPQTQFIGQAFAKSEWSVPHVCLIPFARQLNRDWRWLACCNQSTQTIKSSQQSFFLDLKMKNNPWCWKLTSSSCCSISLAKMKFSAFREGNWAKRPKSKKLRISFFVFWRSLKILEIPHSKKDQNPRILMRNNNTGLPKIRNELWWRDEQGECWRAWHFVVNWIKPVMAWLLNTCASTNMLFLILVNISSNTMCNDGIVEYIGSSTDCLSLGGGWCW